MKIFRVAVIGCGAISVNHINAIIGSGNKICALCDIVPERIQEKIEKYKKEADISQLNDTPSRQRIIDENDHIYETDTEEYISILKTITTKQDRNPNSGVIEYNYEKIGKFNYRYLTARECIIAMGFDEADYDALAEYNASKNSLRDMFSEWENEAAWSDPENTIPAPKKKLRRISKS